MTPVSATLWRCWVCFPNITDCPVHPDVRPVLNWTGIKIVIGRTTSCYWSPTLNQPIALGLVERGPERKSEVIRFPAEPGRTIRAMIVEPVILGQGKGQRHHSKGTPGRLSTTII